MRLVNLFAVMLLSVTLIVSSIGTARGDEAIVSGLGSRFPADKDWSCQVFQVEDRDNGGGAVKEAVRQGGLFFREVTQYTVGIVYGVIQVFTQPQNIAQEALRGDKVEYIQCTSSDGESVKTVASPASSTAGDTGLIADIQNDNQSVKLYGTRSTSSDTSPSTP